MKRKNVIYGYTLGTGVRYYFPDRYEKVTHKGYPIKNTFKSKDGTKYVVVERQKGTLRSPDYVVGSIYDSESGYWQQGHYDFPTKNLQ